MNADRHHATAGQAAALLSPRRAAGGRCRRSSGRWLPRLGPRPPRRVPESRRHLRPVPGPPAPPRCGRTRPRRLRITWVTTPPGTGSGGHTTMFRMVEALESAGHECTLALYNPHGSDLAERTRIIREGWPGVRARVTGLLEGLDAADAAVATAWQTAHALARHGTARDALALLRPGLRAALLPPGHRGRPRGAQLPLRLSDDRARGTWSPDISATTSA